jgi:hypothetical protein
MVHRDIAPGCPPRLSVPPGLYDVHGTLTIGHLDQHSLGIVVKLQRIAGPETPEVQMRSEGLDDLCGDGLVNAVGRQSMRERPASSQEVSAGWRGGRRDGGLVLAAPAEGQTERWNDDGQADRGQE